MPSLPDADVLLVVPPLAHLSWPSLGVETLAALARREGHRVTVLYANLRLAERVGTLTYANLANAPGDWLMGERLFAQAAHGVDGLGGAAFQERVAAHDRDAGEKARRYLDHLSDGAGGVPEAWGTAYPLAELRGVEAHCTALLDELCDEIADRYPIVGLTTSFDQTNAAAGLVSRLKRAHPHVVTLIGGANCTGDMARGVRSVVPSVDHVFAGESEAAFLRFLRGDVRTPIIEGSPCDVLDALPLPDYDAYFAQLAAHAPDVLNGPVWLAYETSRGCWWGQRHHCTFCGLNGTGMGFRERSPEQALAQLRALFDRHPTRHVAMTDNIMPHRYHQTLIPALAAADLGGHVFYEQKANLTLGQVVALGQAGVKVIQPGIESLSTPLLTLMRKGVRARQNIDLLRFSASAGVMVKWNLLWAFPGDDAEDYAKMVTFVPLLHHLTPPNALTHLSIDRFSPYFDEPDRFGLSQIRPLPAYAEVFPPSSDLGALAYHFDAEWTSGSEAAPDVMGRLWAAVQDWRRAWDEGAPPVLRVARAGAGWVLTDTRGGTAFVRLTRSQAVAVTSGGRAGEGAGAWAVRRGYALDLDGRVVGLATGTPEVLAALQDVAGADLRGVTVVATVTP